MSVPLFSPIRLRSVELDNRVVVSPMCQYQSVDGVAQDWHLMHLGQYCMGAAALVFTEATHVSPEGRISPRCLALHNDDQQQALHRVLTFCRQHGVSRLAIQIAHAGRKASTRPPQQGGTPLPVEEGRWQTLAPSAVPYAEDWPVPQALDQGGIAAVREQFVQATRRADQLGFDVAELHAAHGYLAHEFLSPLSNRREDNYGGSLENRMRFPLETFEAMRAVWPDQKPLGVRLSATDWVEGGWDIDECVVLARELKALGCDFIDVSSGGLHPAQKIPLRPGYQVPFAARIRREADIAVMAVGMIRDPELANDIVANGEADFVALARGMMYDPRWAWHAAQALGADTPYADQYARCKPALWPQAFAAMAAE